MHMTPLILQHALVLLPYAVAVFGSMGLYGVLLHIDIVGEDSWLQVSAIHSADELARCLAVIATHGLELISEEESPSRLMSDGSFRTYLAEARVLAVAA